MKKPQKRTATPLIASLILTVSVLSYGVAAQAGVPLVYWNNNGHCVERAESDSSGENEIIRDASLCNKGKPVFLSDGKSCFKLESEQINTASESQNQKPYQLRPVSFFHCNSTKPLFWKIGNMSCMKTENDQNPNRRKSETVSIAECPKGIRPMNGACYVDTHFDSKSQFTRAQALLDSTPCDYTRYITFGQTCYHFLAKNPTFYSPNLFSNYKTFDYSIHRIESKYCKKGHTPRHPTLLNQNDTENEYSQGSR
ncbi:MAG: hypothetical protein RJB66_1798 [Pseudomonadota bacterium]